MVVFGLGKELLFKSVLGNCVLVHFCHGAHSYGLEMGNEKQQNLPAKGKILTSFGSYFGRNDDFID